jgi:cephalosporin-C deacetylase
MPRPRSFLAALLLAALPAAVAAQQPATPTVQVVVRTDRPEALYLPGETATFLVAIRRDNRPAAGERLTVLLTNDGFKSLGDRMITTDARGMAAVEASLPEAGFLRCVVRVGEGRNTVTAIGGAGFDPERIRPAAKLPEDFDRFWSTQKAELAKVPVDPKLTPVERFSTTELDAFKINLANIGGARVYGWLCVPKKQGPFPAVLTVPGAGVYPQNPVTDIARMGALSLSISVHDMEVDLPQSAYTDANNGALRSYPHQGKTDREKSYYRRVVLGCVRALDYLTSRPDWNRKHLAVVGGSQGGALSLITGGVDPRVTAICPNVPAMCDHTGFKIDRVSGWPQWAANVPEAEKDAVAHASAYYDAVNFARRFDGPALLGVGFIDTVCPPTTVYAAYNALRGPKEMVRSPLMGHSTDPRFTARRTEFLKAHWGTR